MKNIEAIRKVLKHLVFDPIDIKFDLQEDDDNLFLLVIFVDASRYHEEGENVEEVYEESLDNISNKIDDALKDVGHVGVIYMITYEKYNDGFIYDKVIPKIHTALEVFKKEYDVEFEYDVSYIFEGRNPWGEMSVKIDPYNVPLGNGIYYFLTDGGGYDIIKLHDYYINLHQK